MLYCVDWWNEYSVPGIAAFRLYLGIVWEAIRETSSHATSQGTHGHSRLSALSHWTDSGIRVELVRAN